MEQKIEFSEEETEEFKAASDKNLSMPTEFDNEITKKRTYLYDWDEIERFRRNGFPKEEPKTNYIKKDDVFMKSLESIKETVNILIAYNERLEDTIERYNNMTIREFTEMKRSNKQCAKLTKKKQ